MKKLMAKIKGGDYKGFFLRHGEKLGMATTALIAFICLSMTSWRGYPNTPEEMKDRAAKVETELRGNVWPADKKAEFVPVTSEHAIAAISAPVNLGNFMHSVIMSPKLYTYRQPADEPVVITVTELQVSSGQMPLDVIIPLPEESAEDADEGVPLAAGSRPDRGGGSRSRERAAERAADKLADKVGVRPGAFPGDRSSSGMVRGGGKAVARGGSRPGDLIMSSQADDDFSGAAAAGLPLGAMGMAMKGVGSATGKARGVRYNVVTGIVDRRKQLERLKEALHLESPGDVPEYLEYEDFKIQRQRAQPGPKPWSDDPNSWKDLDTSHSIDLLVNEAVDFDPDVVAAEYINDAITSPLPHRLDGDWDFAEVGHPKVPKLDLEEREIEAATNLAAAQVAADAEQDPEEARMNRGFRRAQKDPMQLRQQAMRVDGGAARMNDMRRQIMMSSDDDDEMQRRTVGYGVSGGGGRRSRLNAPAGMGGRMRTQMMGNPDMDDYGYYGAVGGVTIADTLLFRYFDFDIEPGECYRYRVQIVIRNPSEGEEYVSNPEVANGPDRPSDWSKPSPLVLVPKDVEYSLVRIYKRSGRREGAVLNVVQFDTDVGTLVSDNLSLKYGEYVGGTRKSDHLNLSVPSFQAEDVNFTSKEIMVDSASGPTIGGAALQDLKLNARQAQRLLEGGALDHAVTLNRFGELVPLDADARAGYVSARKRYKAQADEYADLKEESTAQAAIEKLSARDLIGQMMRNFGQGDDGEMMRTSFNPLKRGQGAGMVAGGMDPGGGRVPPRRRGGRNRRGD